MSGNSGYWGKRAAEFRCAIVDEQILHTLIRRYDEVEKPLLTPDELEILTFALYMESLRRNGAVAKARNQST